MESKGDSVMLSEAIIKSLSREMPKDGKNRNIFIITPNEEVHNQELVFKKQQEICSINCRVHILGLGKSFDRNFAEKVAFYGLGCWK